VNKLQKQLEEGLLYSRFSEFAAKEKKALADIEAIQQRIKTYCSCSWGKQSIILAHLIFQSKLDIPVVFFNEPDTDIIDNFAEIRDWFCSNFPVNYIEINDGQCSPRRSGKTFAENNEYGGTILGLAAHESRARFYSLFKADRNNIFKYSDGRYRCCPLARWEFMDYAAYIAKYRLRLLSTYERFGLEARTSAGITPGRPSFQGIDFLPPSKQAEMRKRLKVRHEL